MAARELISLDLTIIYLDPMRSLFPFLILLIMIIFLVYYPVKNDGYRLNISNYIYFKIKTNSDELLQKIK